MELSPLSAAVVEGDFSAASQETSTLLDDGVTAQAVLNEHLIPAMNEVGRLYDEGEYFVPELLMAAKAMQDSMAVLDPYLKAGGVEKIGKIVIGTVAGDMHDIGKNLVASMLEGAGFEVTDLGVDVPVTKFVETVKSVSGPMTLALSALLTTTMPQMKEIIDALDASGDRNRVRVMIGGAPVSERFAQEIGADGYSDSANAAVRLARSFVERS